MNLEHTVLIKVPGFSSDRSEKSHGFLIYHLATFIFSKIFCGKKFLLIKLIKFYFSNGFLSKFQKVILQKSFATQICSLLCPIDDKNGRGHPGTRGGTLQNGSCLNS